MSKTVSLHSYTKTKITSSMQILTDQYLENQLVVSSHSGCLWRHKRLGIIQESNGLIFPSGNNGLSVTHTHTHIDILHGKLTHTLMKNMIKLPLCLKGVDD
jgi:hypothetical protein